MKATAMKYRFQVTQTIYKNVEVEADNEAEAYEQTDKMLSEGAIRVDDEPYLKTECSIKPVISCLTPCDIDTTYTRGTDSHFGQDNIFKL
jgi:hypothetical protein